MNGVQDHVHGKRQLDDGGVTGVTSKRLKPQEAQGTKRLLDPTHPVEAGVTHSKRVKGPLLSSEQLTKSFVTVAQVVKQQSGARYVPFCC
jgi:hypothetical protein